MKLIILSGFLGSGKTSFLLRLIDQLASKTDGAMSSRIAIIENEIGSVSVDGKVIASKGLEMRELLSGCICCSLSGNLLQGVMELQSSVNPDWLIIEATGLASASQIKNTLSENREWRNSLLTLVLIDAGRFLTLLKTTEPMMVRQLEEVDVIILNKVDIVSDPVREETRKKLQELKPGIAVVETISTQNIPKELWTQIAEELG